MPRIRCGDDVEARADLAPGVRRARPAKGGANRRLHAAALQLHGSGDHRRLRRAARHGRPARAIGAGPGRARCPCTSDCQRLAGGARHRVARRARCADGTSTARRSVTTCLLRCSSVTSSRLHGAARSRRHACSHPRSHSGWRDHNRSAISPCSTVPSLFWKSDSATTTGLSNARPARPLAPTCWGIRCYSISSKRRFAPGGEMRRGGRCPTGATGTDEPGSALRRFPRSVPRLARRRADADELYREAIGCFEAANATLHLARASLLYGEWLRRQKRRTEARQQLRIAYDLLVSMGASAFAERARAELQATGEKVRKRTVETARELTPQEDRIARLAAAGDTNAEIASKMFLSSATSSTTCARCSGSSTSRLVATCGTSSHRRADLEFVAVPSAECGRRLVGAL